MSLNIKNEETCRLASELAELTGETKTGAITVALRERLEREQRERSAEARTEEAASHLGTLRRVLARRRSRRSITATCCMTSAGCPSDRGHVGGPQRSCFDEDGADSAL